MKRILLSNGLEFVWLWLALVVLMLAADPLSNPATVLGRGDRYGLETDQATVLLALNLDLLLTCLALAGWMVLFFGRLSLPPGAVIAFGTAVWGGVFSWLLSIGLLGGSAVSQSIPFDRWPWWAVPACVLATLPILSRLTRRHWQPIQAPNRSWLYPMWVLLTGLGMIWLTDYSARAGFMFRDLALRQFVALSIAYALLTLLASLSPTLLIALSRFLARIDGITPQTNGFTPTGAWRKLWRRFGLLAFTAFWMLGVIVIVGPQKMQTALRAEAFRLPAYVVAGWLAYRWIDTHGGATWDKFRGIVAAGVLGVLALSPLAFTGDNGQILLFTLACAVLAGGIAGALVAPRRAALLGAAIGISLIAVCLWALYRYGPLVSTTVALRIEAIRLAFASHYEYLSELRWFMGNTPSGGWGIGQVPWCGMTGSLGPGSCTGTPKETHSDYVFSAIYGVWGAGVAWFITAATAAWFLGLIRLPSVATLRSAAAPAPQRLGQWIITVFSALSLVQLFVTSCGSLGILPLTGVVYPLLGFGKASLLVVAGMAALGINRPVKN